MDWIISLIEDEIPSSLDAVLYIWDDPKFASQPVQEAEELWNKGCRSFVFSGPRAEFTHNKVDNVFEYNPMYDLEDFPMTAAFEGTIGSFDDLTELLSVYRDMPCCKEILVGVYLVRLLDSNVSKDDVRRAVESLN